MSTMLKVSECFINALRDILIMLQYAVIRRQGDDVQWFTQWFIYAVWSLYNMSVWIMFHRWNGRHGASPRGLKELLLRTWCKIPWLGYCVKPTLSTSIVWICGFAEKSLFVASTLRIIIITACLFTWQIYKKRGKKDVSQTAAHSSSSHLATSVVDKSYWQQGRLLSLFIV